MLLNYNVPVMKVFLLIELVLISEEYRDNQRL